MKCYESITRKRNQSISALLCKFSLTLGPSGPGGPDPPGSPRSPEGPGAPRDPGNPRSPCKDYTFLAAAFIFK